MRALINKKIKGLYKWMIPTHLICKDFFNSCIKSPTSDQPIQVNWNKNLGDENNAPTKLSESMRITSLPTKKELRYSVYNKRIL